MFFKKSDSAGELWLLRRRARALNEYLPLARAIRGAALWERGMLVIVGPLNIDFIGKTDPVTSYWWEINVWRL